MDKCTKAIAEFNKVIEENKAETIRMAACWSYVAECYEELNDRENAAKSWEKALDMKPENVFYLYQYAAMLKDEEKYSEALSYYLRLNELDRNAVYLLHSAYCFENLHDNVNAEIYYLKAIEMGKDRRHSSMLYTWYGQFLRDVMEDYEKAEIYFLEALETNSAGAHAYYEYGIMLQVNMRRYKDALKQYLAALEFDPNSAKCMVQSAICYEILQDDDKANEYYIRAIDKCEDEEEEVKCLNWYGMFLRDDVHKYEEAKECFVKAIEIGPDDQNSYYQYARLLRDYIGDYEEAERCYIKCIEMDPKKQGVNGSYGYLLYLMGKYAKALEYI